MSASLRLPSIKMPSATQAPSILLTDPPTRPQKANASPKPNISYQQHVAAQCQRMPCLRHLSNFLADNTSPPKPTQIACLEFSSAHGEPRRKTLDMTKLAGLLQDPWTKAGDLLGRILVVEDLDKDIIEIIGSSLEVDPLFFASHLQASRAEVTAVNPFPPSKANGHDFIHAGYHRALTFGKSGVPRKLILDAAVRRTVSVFETNDACVGWIQGYISGLVRRRDDSLWLCLFLVDPPVRNGFFSDGRQKNQALDRVNLKLQLFQGGAEDVLIQPPYSEAGGSDTLGRERSSVYDNLIYCWTVKPPAVFDPASPSLLSLSYYPLKIACAEWKNFINLMHYSVKDNESSIDETPISLTDIGRLETRLLNLQSWRRRSRGAADNVSGLSALINDQKTNSSDWEVWSSMADDYEHISRSIEAYSGQFDAMGPVVTSLVQIVDSRRSFTETANLSRLTYLALVFVPLTFVSSLFSMTGDVAPGQRFFWVYFAVAIPSLVLVFLIARPPQNGVSRIAEYLFELTRGRRWRPKEAGA